MINIQDIIPFLKDGWVAMDSDKNWWWFEGKPEKDNFLGQWMPPTRGCFAIPFKNFDIAPADDWTKSLIKVGGK